MNKRLLVLVTAIVVGFLPACDESNESTPDAGYFIYNGTTYPLYKGQIGNYGLEPSGCYNTALYLFSDGLSPDPGLDFVGQGNLIYFALFSTTENALDNSVYQWSSVEETLGTFYQADCMFNYNSVTESYDSKVDIIGGTVSVERNADEYTITFDCTCSNSKKITGTYTGSLSLKYYNWLKNWI